MSHRLLASPSAFVSTLATAALCWLLIGLFTLLLTPLPAHTQRLGWSPTFWLLAAPLCLLMGLGLRASQRVSSRL